MNTWIASRNPAALAEMVTIIETKAPHRIEAAGGDVHYAVWMRSVDSYLRRDTGFLHSDLPDWTWRDAYNDDLTPRAAVRAAITHWRSHGDL